MYSGNQRDLFYETVQPLSFDDLRHLCQSNQTNRLLCQDERVQQLIKRRYIENRINSSDNRRPFQMTFKIFGDDKGRDHSIQINKSALNEIIITETLKNVDYTNSVLYKYMNVLVNFRGFENLTDEELVDFLYNHIPLRLPQNAIDSYINNPNDLIILLIYMANRLLPKTHQNDVNRHDPIFYLNNNSRENYQIGLGYATQKELIDVLELMYTTYPQTNIW